MAETRENDAYVGWMIGSDCCIVQEPSYSDDLSGFNSFTSWRKKADALALVEALQERIDASGLAYTLPIVDTDLPNDKADDLTLLQEVFTTTEILTNVIPEIWNNAANNYKTYGEHWAENAASFPTTADQFEHFCGIAGGSLVDGAEWGFRYTERTDGDFDEKYPSSDRTCTAGDMRMAGMAALMEDLVTAMGAIKYVKWAAPSSVERSFEWTSTTATLYEQAGDNTQVAGDDSYQGEIGPPFSGAKSDYDNGYDTTTTVQIADPHSFAKTHSSFSMLTFGNGGILEVTLTSEAQTCGAEFTAGVDGPYDLHAIGTAHPDGLFNALGSGIADGTWATLVSGNAGVGANTTAEVGNTDVDVLDFPDPIVPAFTIRSVITPLDTEYTGASYDWSLFASVWMVADFNPVDIEISPNTALSFLWDSDASGIDNSTSQNPTATVYGVLNEIQTRTADVACAIWAGTTGEQSSTNAAQAAELTLEYYPS